MFYIRAFEETGVMSSLKIKQINNADSLPDSYIAFNGTGNVWRKIHHTSSFNSLDLFNGVLDVEHELGRKYVSVSVYDEQDMQVIPDFVKVLDNSSLQIGLNSFGYFADWTIAIS
jgi:hypothetical protein